MSARQKKRKLFGRDEKSMGWLHEKNLFLHADEYFRL
jgi:hypothetical protein